jgi:hypothetical protein
LILSAKNACIPKDFIYFRNLTKSSMKYSLLLSGLILSLFACNVSNETDYKNMAADTCDCVSKLTNNLSPEMMAILETFDGDQAALEAKMMEYMEADPVAGMKDVQILEGSGQAEMTACMEKVEKKYDDVYTMLSEEQVAEKIIEKLETMDGCKSTITILRVGMAAK